uniref:VPS9 domain containing 1 n=1 Tax=Pan paniscus TaxID=9597 RepID=A0A2R9CR61_PANPA
MAAAAGDGTVKPLQSAMKLANGAIELDTGNRPGADATGGGLPAESEAEGCV